MRVLPYTCIALDLETTGLSPESDTIIEIAAIKFQIIEDSGAYRTEIIDERTMLIDPERPLSEEVQMITHITPTMLEGRAKWNDVREKVAHFLSDAIIVGHNVLFDVSMLKTHGIDLTEYCIIDTFELAEIFSQGVESLNLGFLAKYYGILSESEHRALDDTKLSIQLFEVYLNKLANSTPKTLEIWHTFREQDQTHTIETLLSITGKYPYTTVSYALKHSSTKKACAYQETKENDLSIPNCFSLSGDWNEELSLIKDNHKSTTKILIITTNKKHSEWLLQKLTSAGISTKRSRDPSQFVSILSLQAGLQKTERSRKETIFLLKLVCWVESTQTGLLDELKYYGEERKWIDLYRCSENEMHLWREAQDIHERESDILITELTDRRLSNGALRNSGATFWYDIMRHEEIIRHTQSIHIRFEELYQFLEMIRSKLNENILTALLTYTGILQDILENVQTRPTGENPLPPGEHGETYFFEQKALWHRGCTWGKMSARELIHLIDELEHIPKDYFESKQYSKIGQMYRALVQMFFYTDTDHGYIVRIKHSGTELHIIPRHIGKIWHDLINKQNHGNTLLLGYGINNDLSMKFLKNEYDLSSITVQTPGSHTYPDNTVSPTKNKQVLLTTSMSHSRTLTHELKKGGYTGQILTQGLSGGKGKMLSLHTNATEPSTIIGTIEMWQNEMTLWAISDRIEITKTPFDPPADPYFLARTTGMSSNFNEYSLPLVLSRINTLLGRILAANPHAQIIFSDERLEKTIWGKQLASEFIHKITRH